MFNDVSFSPAIIDENIFTMEKRFIDTFGSRRLKTVDSERGFCRRPLETVMRADFQNTMYFLLSFDHDYFSWDEPDLTSICSSSLLVLMSNVVCVSLKFKRTVA